MSKKKRRGAFIVLEGIDGSGTTTQVAALCSWLVERGELAHRTREPSDGPIGTQIRQILSGRLVSRQVEGKVEPVIPATVALLFAADRLDHVASEIDPHRAAGFHVVSDRYVLSSLAYQSQSTDEAFVRQINTRAAQPDLTLFLRVRPEVAMSRISASRGTRERFENLPFLRATAEAYDRIIDGGGLGKVIVLDGEDAPGTVTRRTRAAVEELLEI